MERRNPSGCVGWSSRPVWVATLLSATIAGAGPASIDFGREIMPIFAERCIKCHGEAESNGGLRLSDRAGALAELDSGARAVVPGDPQQSELLRRITASDPDVRMPPEGEPVGPDEIARLRRWIEQGAGWQSHWAFRPLAASLVPVLRDAWLSNGIDPFVLARLEKAGIRPSPEAERHTLAKRLAYDLLGLPPDPETVDTFLSDPAPDAYERLVDRLVASPHFGERWGRHWLDKARYADSDGYEKDNPRPDAWRYRDWVIDAVNQDLPFDQFTIEQFAGDLLANGSPMQKLATAFQRQTLTNTEGGTDKEQFRIEAVFDRVETTGTVWLGLTVGCARCHTHKFDPITHREYYRLFHFFNDADESATEVSISDLALVKYEAARAQHEAATQALGERLAAEKAKLGPALAEWERKLAPALADPIRFHPVTVLDAKSKSGATLKPLSDGSFLATGMDPDQDEYVLVVETNVPAVSGLRLELLPDDSLPRRGPGRSASGGFALSEIAVWRGEIDPKLAEAAPAPLATDKEAGEKLALGPPRADQADQDQPIQGVLDGDLKTGWGVASPAGKTYQAIFPMAQSTEPGLTRMTVLLVQREGRRQNIGRFRIQVMTGTDPGVELPDPIRAILGSAAEQRSPEQRKTLLDFFAVIHPETKKLLGQIEPPKPPLMTVRVLAQRTTDPRRTHILHRGDFLQPAEPVDPGTLACLPELRPRGIEGPADRLDLAHWLIGGGNPLVPRVAANHIWSRLLGRGIVATVNDFGVRGEPPTHPELLDWLAREYLRRRWSQKSLIRLVVGSATYRQASWHRPDLAEIDSNNRLLARQNRFRVEAEIVRDLSLAAGGLFVPIVGGPSVFPPMPGDVASLSYANNFKWNTSQGADRYRRGMYTFFKRTAPHPNLVTFDCPDANTTCVERRTSNTPLQALTMLNNETFLETAQALAGRLLMAEPELRDSDRLAQAFRRCTARPPESGELARLLEFVAASRAWYDAHPDEASRMAGALPPGKTAAEAAAWVAVARILLNLDEFVTRE